jgi:uncharacterized membrane protein
LVRLASELGVVIHVRYRPGHFLVQGHAYATVWPAEAAEGVARELSGAHVTGPYRTLAQDVSFGVDQLVEIAIRALSRRSTTPSRRSPALTGSATACAR